MMGEEKNLKKTMNKERKKWKKGELERSERRLGMKKGTGSQRLAVGAEVRIWLLGYYKFLKLWEHVFHAIIPDMII